MERKSQDVDVEVKGEGGDDEDWQEPERAVALDSGRLVQVVGSVCGVWRNSLSVRHRSFSNLSSMTALLMSAEEDHRRPSP